MAAVGENLSSAGMGYGDRFCIKTCFGMNMKTSSPETVLKLEVLRQDGSSAKVMFRQFGADPVEVCFPHDKQVYCLNRDDLMKYLGGKIQRKAIEKIQSLEERGNRIVELTLSNPPFNHPSKKAISLSSMKPSVVQSFLKMHFCDETLEEGPFKQCLEKGGEDTEIPLALIRSNKDAFKQMGSFKEVFPSTRLKKRCSPKGAPILLVGKGDKVFAYPTSLSLLDGQHWKNELNAARRLMTLSHPNIVRVTDVSDSRIEMDRVKGITGREFLYRLSARVEWDEGDLQIIDSFFMGCLKALIYLHDQKIWHGDLSIYNMMLSKTSGECVLLDFGLMKEGVPNNCFKRGCSGRVVNYPPEVFFLNATCYPSEIWAFGEMVNLILSSKSKPVNCLFDLYMKKTPLSEENMRSLMEDKLKVMMMNLENKFLGRFEGEVLEKVCCYIEVLSAIWQINPVKRPTAKQLFDYLSDPSNPSKQLKPNGQEYDYTIPKSWPNKPNEVLPKKLSQVPNNDDPLRGYYPGAVDDESYNIPVFKGGAVESVI